MKVWFNRISESRRSMVEVGGTEFRIGRDDVNDIVLASPLVSRQHAVVRVQNGQLELENVGLNSCLVGDTEVLGGQTASFAPGAKIRIWPLTDGADFLFENEITKGAIPREFIRPVEIGIREAMDRGVLAGYPVMGLGAALYDGSFHEVDSSELAFKVAGSMAFQDAAKEARPMIMEPVMEVEAVTPEEYLGDVIGDLNRRGGRVLGMESRAGFQVATVHVPLFEMFGYATDLRSATQGRATYSMEFDHYDEVPQRRADEIIARATGMTA